MLANWASSALARHCGPKFELILFYFNLGVNNNDVLKSTAVSHGIILSQRLNLIGLLQNEHPSHFNHPALESSRIIISWPQLNDLSPW